MSQHAFLYILYVLIVLPAMGAALVCGLTLWSWRRINGESAYFVGNAFLLIAIFGHRLFSILVAGGFGYKIRPVPTIGHAWGFWIGEFLLAAGLWNFARVLFRKRKKAAAATALTSEDERVLELERAHDRRVQELDAYHDARVKRRDATIHFLRNRLNALEAMAQSMGIHLPPMEAQEEDPPRPEKNNG